MALPTILQFLCITGEFVVLVQALRYRLWRAMPLFVCYLAWNLFSDVAMSPLFSWSPRLLWQLFRIDVSVDLVAQTVVLIELAWKVLRQAFPGLARRTVAALAGAATLLLILIWPVTARLTDAPSPYNIAIRIPQAEHILGFVWILGLGLVSLIYSLTWKGRLLQVAAGLLGYAFSGVVVAVYRLATGIDPQGFLLQPATILVYVGVLVYWIKSFSVQRISALIPA
ncbi:MAG TPA: hypothetical protein VIM62_11175 [Acidobacteriaceae bacterium]